jgi:hypothetical protein
VEEYHPDSRYKREERTNEITVIILLVCWMEQVVHGRYNSYASWVEGLPVQVVGEHCLLYKQAEPEAKN